MVRKMMLLCVLVLLAGFGNLAFAAGEPFETLLLPFSPGCHPEGRIPIAPTHPGVQDGVNCHGKEACP